MKACRDGEREEGREREVVAHLHRAARLLCETNGRPQHAHARGLEKVSVSQSFIKR